MSWLAVSSHSNLGLKKTQGNPINTGHKKHAIFTGLRTAAELPALNLKDTTYEGPFCFREDAGLFLSTVGVIIGRPKKSTAGCVHFSFGFRTVLREGWRDDPPFP